MDPRRKPGLQVARIKEHADGISRFDAIEHKGDVYQFVIPEEEDPLATFYLKYRTTVMLASRLVVAELTAFRSALGPEECHAGTCKASRSHHGDPR